MGSELTVSAARGDLEEIALAPWRISGTEARAAALSMLEMNTSCWAMMVWFSLLAAMDMRCGGTLSVGAGRGWLVVEAEAGSHVIVVEGGGRRRRRSRDWG